MIYITNEDESFIAGLVLRSSKSSKKIIKKIESLLEEKLYEAESDIYDEYDGEYNYDLIVLEKEFFFEDILEILNNHTKLIII